MSKEEFDYTDKINILVKLKVSRYHPKIVVEDIEIQEDKLKCPECLREVEQCELDMFGGLCEECSAY